MRIDVPFEQLKHVVHIADIHIRLFRRHDEYESAFQKLYSDIKAKKLNDFAIVLAGDILHAKTDMSPEMVRVASKFLSAIADIAPTILIAGNHDCNLANEHRLDSLTPIVENLNHPNLFYQKNSGIVSIADTDFAVCSVFDSQENWPSAVDCKGSTKIALYHGPVHGALTDANFVITNRHVHVSIFGGYDIVMLGDIHRHQILQEYNPQENQPIIVYASSLIQQNHGETLDNHGWCLWDIPARSFDFFELENEYGYVTLEVVNGQLQQPTNMPKNIRARLFTENLDNTQVKKLISILKNKHNIIELSVNKSRTAKTINRSGNITQHQLLNLSDLSTQNELIRDWLTRNEPSLSKDMIANILKLNGNLNHTIAHEDFSRNVHWRPLVFKFNNMFSYGDTNEINFADMRGLYGIFAANASGKSSIMDSLMFCLYDKTPRAFKGDHIINNRKDTFECELTFEINNETFGIKRTGTRKKTGDVKVDVEFWKIQDNGDKLSLNGEDRRDTNANIRSYVGTYEDFVMTAYSGQSANSLFIDKSHSERKDLLMQFMGLNVFDKLYDVANDDMKEISGILKRFKKSDVTDQLAEVHQNLTKVTERIEEFESGKETFTQTLAEIEAEYKEKYGTKRPVPETSGNWTDLQNKLIATEKKLKTAQEDVAIAEYALVSSETDLKEAIVEFGHYNMSELQVSFDKWNELNELLKKKNNSIRVLTTKIQEKTVFKTKLEAYKYNPNCDVCVENNRSVIEDVKLVNVELDNLYAERSTEENAVHTISTELVEHLSNKDSYEKAILLQKELVQLGQAVEKSKNVLENTKNVLEKIRISWSKVQDEISVYKTNEENILHNQTVEKELQVIQRNITDTKQNVSNIDKELRLLHGDLSVLNAQKNDLRNKLKEAEELEENHNAYLHYLSAIGRDGIPYEIISKTIPNIQTEINNLLSQIVDFVVTLEVDGKNINAKLTYDFDRIWPLENSSGMERFVTSLAIRVALMNASNLPKPNFLMIDEGFGALDTDHLQSMQTLFNLLKTQFDFILIVSHLDTARDMVDNLIEIRKEDGYSQISI